MNIPKYNIDEAPANKGAPLLNSDKKSVSFDVHGSYKWALNASAELRKYIPKIVLTEYKLTSSSQARALKLGIAQAAESKLGSTVAGAQLGGNTLTAFGVNPGIAKLVGAGVGLLASTQINGKNVVGALTGFQNKTPYKDLYAGELTGFTYTLPYLHTDNMISSAIGAWQGVDAGAAANMVQKGVTAVGKSLGTIVGAATTAGVGALANTYETARAVGDMSLSLSEPGIAKETIKAFTPSQNGDTLTVTFYLFNTQEFKDIRDNWDFLFTLTYQNLPNRRSLNLMDPPCIYSVEVPGYKRFPAAVIEGLQVTNVGTTRLVNIDTGEVTSVVNSSSVKIIPEAYKVTMTIRSLVMNSRNIFYYMNSTADSPKVNIIEEEK